MRCVIARVSVSKGDTYAVESVRAFPDAAAAREAFEAEGYAARSGGAWPDWVEYHVLWESDGRFTDLEGRPFVTVWDT